MLYSSAGLLGLIINLIINNDILRDHESDRYDPTRRLYRRFLLSLNLFFVTDIIWGILYEHQLITLVFVDTVLYFLAMGCTILYWTMYAVSYMQEKDKPFSRVLLGIGWVIFVFQILALIVNFFVPVVFSFDSQGVYHADFARYITLALQIFMYFITALYTLVISGRSSGHKRFRHLTIALSSIAMGIFTGVQVQFPLLPLYAIGCMLSTCVLHSFVHENEKEEYRDTLEERLQDSILKGNYYDLLTGMPGMSYFFEIAAQKREEMLKNGGRPAFLFFDLSGMKFFNQKHGFAEGDRILREFSQLLIRSYGENNCSRLGSDHFAVFTEESGLEDTLREIIRTWEARKDSELPAVRAGIYLDYGQNVDISTACDRAKAARDTIRSSYRSDYRYFDDDMLRKAEHSQYIISHLDKALAEGWIEVYYQPIIRAINGRVCDEEALARWKDPERGFLSPADFIPALENAGLIYKLDLHVLDLVIEKIRRIEAAGLHIVPQSINLSRSDFDSCDIVEEIRKRMDQAGLPHHLLSIEITESIIGSNFEFIRRKIDRFRALGFPVWMDDFGSGYSSLDVLSDMPVDLIKLDMRFLQKTDNQDKSRIILTELVKMAIALGIDTVCEGVEEKEQMEFLRDIGCAKLQGYYYTKPLPLNAILTRYEKGVQIGFENPEQSDYFDAVGRINLYDIGVLMHTEVSPQHGFFRAIPMAILEMHGNKVRLSRSNLAYRDFSGQTFEFAFAERTGAFDDLPDMPDGIFFETVRRLARDGGSAFTDEAQPDGTVIHSFMRRVAIDRITDTTALVVAVLSITPPHSSRPQSLLGSQKTTNS